MKQVMLVNADGNVFACKKYSSSVMFIWKRDGPFLAPWYYEDCANRRRGESGAPGPNLHFGQALHLTTSLLVLMFFGTPTGNCSKL
jgi:hypothetical protein